MTGKCECCGRFTSPSDFHNVELVGRATGKLYKQKVCTKCEVGLHRHGWVTPIAVML